MHHVWDHLAHISFLILEPVAVAVHGGLCSLDGQIFNSFCFQRSLLQVKSTFLLKIQNPLRELCVSGLTVCQINTSVFETLLECWSNNPKLLFPLQPSWWALEHPFSFALWLRQCSILWHCFQPSLCCVPRAAALPAGSFIPVFMRDSAPQQCYQGWKLSDPISQLRHRKNKVKRWQWFQHLIEEMSVWWFGHIWQFRAQNTPTGIVHCQPLQLGELQHLRQQKIGKEIQDQWSLILGLV